GPAEERIRAYLDQHVQVAGGTATVTWLATPSEPDALAVGHSGRDPDVHRAGLGDPSGAVALWALLLHDGTDALTVAARLGGAERALVTGGQAASAADRTGARLGTRLGPVAVAGVADARGPQRQRQRYADDRVPEFERHLGFDIPPAGRSPPAIPTTREDRG